MYKTTQKMSNLFYALQLGIIHIFSITCCIESPLPPNVISVLLCPVLGGLEVNIDSINTTRRSCRRAITQRDDQIS